MSTTANQLCIDYRCSIPNDWLSFLYSNKNNWKLLLQAQCAFDILRMQDQNATSCILRFLSTDKEKVEEKMSQLKGLTFESSDLSGFQIERFGGYDSSSSIMNFFQQSSNSILRLFQDHEDVLQYEDILSIAVFMGKIFFKTLSFDPIIQKESLALSFEHWSAFLPKGINLEIIKTGYSEEVGILKTLEQVSPIQNWSVAMRNHFELWSLATNNLVLTLKNFETQNLIEQRPKEFNYKNSQVENSNLMEIYNDCFHFILNKLGVNNEDEALVIYLVSELMNIPLKNV